MKTRRITRSMATGVVVGVLAMLSPPMVFSGQTSADLDVTVLSSDNRSIVFEYRPRFLDVRTVNEQGMRMQVYDFIGSSSSDSFDAVGSPDLKYRSVPLGFPARDGNAVQVLQSDYEEISGVTVAPVPTLRVRDDMVEVDKYRIASAKYATSSFIPAQSVELPSPGYSRTMCVGYVKLFPVQYNPSTRTVRKYSRMVVQVVYGSFSRSRAVNSDDKPFRGVLLNYDVARNWKSAGPESSNRAPVISSVLGTGEWYRIPIQDEGMYILTPQYLANLGINAPSIDPRTIRIYGNGGNEVPEDPAQARPEDLIENAIYVEGETDGRLDAGDYVVFYGRSVRNWTYNVSTHSLSHYINHYTEQNYYWLTYGGSNGRRMEIQPSLTDNPVAVPAQFLDGVLVEQEAVNIQSSGKDWFGHTYSPNGSFTYVNPLPGLVSDQQITYRMRLLAQQTSGLASFIVRDGSDSLGQFYISAGEDPYAVTVGATGPSNKVGNTSNLSFTFKSGVTATGWNDWIEIQYPRRFEASNNLLRFRSPDNVSGPVQYNLTQFTSPPFIFDVTQPENVRRISGATGTYSFVAAETTGRVSEYCAVTSGAFKQPASGATRVANQNLHGDTTGADFIIITSPEFLSAANRLRDFREQPQHGDLRTTVVAVGKIYNEFGGGIPDITAIRDYLRYAYDNWMRPPQFVLFFGQGSYDYKGLRGSRSSYVPTWQSPESLSHIFSYSTDDFFVEFGPSSRVYLIGGRINARSSTEAGAFVTKLIGYETNSARDSWQMRMLFVADDGWTTEGDDGTLHSDQAEALATLYTPDEFDKEKIYIAEYPTVETAQGRRKPGAYQAIIDRINEGTLVVNFTGHGNPTVWTHESVFSVTTSIPQLVNDHRLAVFFLATCNFSQFDDPGRETGSELLMNKPDGGAIAVVSATRAVYSYENAALHQQIFHFMFQRVSGRLIVERPATALYLFKSTGGNGTNDQKFFYMGDPTMRLQYPSGYATIDSINHDSLSGPPVALRALARVSVQGTIRNVSNQPDSTFNGRLVLTVNDASRTITIAGFYRTSGALFTYLSSGGTIYHGQNSIVNGRFNATFVVPKDILYADSTSKGRIVAYCVDSLRAMESAGYTNNVWVGGTADAPPDTSGPAMSLYLGSRSFRPGDVVGENPLLLVDLSDSNGINTSVSGIGHHIEAWLNGSSQSKDITDYYASDLDNFQKGTVQYPVKDLPQGKNAVRVRAWDTYNNATESETFFEVASTDQLKISDVFNYPNPFSSSTYFTFRQNLRENLNVTVKIYTLAGRLIQSIDTISPAESFVKIPWNGRDRDGDILANGVYLYKLVVRTTDGRFGTEVLGKLSVLK